MHYDSSELRENEVFIGNTRDIDAFPPEHQKRLRTIRLGKQAYDIYGNKLPQDYCRPVFIDKSEYGLYNQIMTEESSRYNRNQ